MYLDLDLFFFRSTVLGIKWALTIKKYMFFESGKFSYDCSISQYFDTNPSVIFFSAVFFLLNFYPKLSIDIVTFSALF